MRGSPSDKTDIALLVWTSGQAKKEGENGDTHTGSEVDTFGSSFSSLTQMQERSTGFADSERNKF